MNAQWVKNEIRNYGKSLKKLEQLQRKANRRDPLQQMLILKRLEELNYKIKVLENALYESDLLSDKESCILLYRAEGFTYEEIAKVFSITKQRVHSILDNSYQKIAENIKDLPIAI